MSGLKTSYRPILLNLASLALALGVLSAPCFAHVPQSGQLARYQANILHSAHSFVSKGSLNIARSKIGYLLQWAGPENYQVTLSNIPRTFYNGSGATPATWVFRRDSKICVLKTDATTVNCGSPMFWAYLELSGLPDATAKSLRAAGFFGDGDVAFHETDSAKELADDPKRRRVQLALGSNGNTPIAVLQVKGENVTGEGDQAYPVIQFDQTFLSPLMARWMGDGELLTLKATSDLETGRKRPRFTHVLSEILEVYSGKDLLATLSRTDKEESASKITLALPPRGAGSLDNLKSNLSADGSNLLKTLLLTH